MTLYHLDVPQEAHFNVYNLMDISFYKTNKKRHMQFKLCSLLNKSLETTTVSKVSLFTTYRGKY